MQIGFIERTPRGRRVTPKAMRHLNTEKNDEK
jgi:Holliday junction resolvasome RuvABC ATP-dependent DNA helicase subunit